MRYKSRPSAGQPSERYRASIHGGGRGQSCAAIAPEASSPRTLHCFRSGASPPFPAATMSDALPTNVSQNQVQVHVNSDQSFIEDCLAFAVGPVPLQLGISTNKALSTLPISNAVNSEQIAFRNRELPRGAGGGWWVGVGEVSRHRGQRYYASTASVRWPPDTRAYMH